MQSITGSLLYYARAIDGTLLPALNDIASQQAQPTEYTMVKCKRLLDYVSTYPNATIRYHASNTKLHIDSDTAYLVMPNARSSVARVFNLGHPNTFMTQQQPNGAIIIEYKILRHVVASAGSRWYIPQCANSTSNTVHALSIRAPTRAYGNQN